MPSRNPKTGKELPGSVKEKKKREKLEALSRDEDPCLWAKEFDAAGTPDLDNPETDLAYVRKLQLIVLQQMAKTSKPSVAQQEFWRRIKDMAATVGMTSNRAVLEATAKKMRASLKAQQAAAGAVVYEDTSTIIKPPTARGQRRGPRPLPPTEGDTPDTE